MFHGGNTNKEIIWWQSSLLREIFSEVMEFYAIDSGLDVIEDVEPNQKLVERGFKPPFRHWFKTASWYTEAGFKELSLKTDLAIGME